MRDAGNTKKNTLLATSIPGPPQLGVEDIDQAVIDLFDKRLNFHLPSIRERNQSGVSNQKVPVVFSGAELFALTANTDVPVRDENGAVVTPIISITRKNISKDDYKGIVPNRYIRTFVHRVQTGTGERKLQVPNQRGIIIGRNSTNVKHPVVEFISADRPEYYGITYEVIYWCSYQEHMNQLITLTQKDLDSPNIFYLILSNGWKLNSFFDGSFAYSGNVDSYFGEERVIKYNFTLSVDAPLMSQAGSNINVYKTTSPRTFAFKISDSPSIQRIKSEEDAMNLLRYRNIHGSGADTADEAILSPEDYNLYRRPRVRIDTSFATPLFSPDRLKELLLYHPTISTQKELDVTDNIKRRRKRQESEFVVESKDILNLIFNSNIVLQ